MNPYLFENSERMLENLGKTEKHKHRNVVAGMDMLSQIQAAVANLEKEKSQFSQKPAIEAKTEMD